LIYHVTVQTNNTYFTMAVVSSVKRESSDKLRRTLIFAAIIFLVSLALLLRGSDSVDYGGSLLVGSPTLEAAATTMQESSLKHTSSDGSGEKYAFVKNALKKTSGEGWEMWNRQAVSTYGKYECLWTSFKAPNGKTAQMCVHPGRDVVSRYIKGKGRFPDCDKLTQRWRKEKKSISDQSIFVEIGGNTGACVMQMLLTTNVPIIVFEPDPRNLVCMTSTLMALSQDQRDRVSLFPIALGSETGNNTINAAKGNFGNSVVGTTVSDNGVNAQKFHPPIPIRVERMDSILDTDNLGWNVPLMNMDAKGYECIVVDGMGAVLNRIGTIVTMMADKWLTAQGCSNAGFANRLRAADFDIINRGKLVQGKPPLKPGNYDILVVKGKKRKMK
jgi:FkbM family methyltransferase